MDVLLTLELEWRLAKWLYRHGDTQRKDLPAWVPADVCISRHHFFHVNHSETDSEGVPILAQNDIFSMSEQDMDTFRDERKTRIYDYRSWITPATAVAALLVSIIALVTSLFF